MRRECGDCQLCCKLIPVKALGKPAGQKCQHQRVGKGCTIYPRRPHECMAWSCAWLINDVNGAAVPIPRPDRSHYVVDCLPDYVDLAGDAGEIIGRMTVLQIWCDPGFPDAHRDPPLRLWLDTMAAQGIGALVRYNSSEAFGLIGPSMPGNDTGDWIESRNATAAPEHDRAEVAKLVSLKFEGKP